jgi:hypothetical protein
MSTPEQRRQWSRDWYRRNAEKAREQKKRYYEKNAEKLIEKQKAYEAGHRTPPRPPAISDEEHKRRVRERYYANVDQSRKRMREYYEANKEAIKARKLACAPQIVEARRKRYSHKRQRVVDSKSKPCLDCGGSFPPECMDFDHVRGKKVANVGGMAGCSDETFFREVAKCDLVCANCHRIRTAERKAIEVAARIIARGKKSSAA